MAPIVITAMVTTAIALTLAAPQRGTLSSRQTSLTAPLYFLITSHPVRSC